MRGGCRTHLLSAGCTGLRRDLALMDSIGWCRVESAAAHGGIGRTRGHIGKASSPTNTSLHVGSAVGRKSADQATLAAWVVPEIEPPAPPRRAAPP